MNIQYIVQQHHNHFGLEKVFILYDIILTLDWLTNENQSKVRFGAIELIHLLLSGLAWRII